MIADRRTSVAFTGHRTYRGAAADALRRTVGELYALGFRNFLSGMAVGFDLAAAEAVLELRERAPGVRLVAAVPFRGQEMRFSPADRERFRRVLAEADSVEVLAPAYHRGCYAVRNDFLVDNARVLVAWYDGSPGGTLHTVSRARRQPLHRPPRPRPGTGGRQPLSGGSRAARSRTDALRIKKRPGGLAWSADCDKLLH